jgi:hypothetical protein
MMMNWLHYLLEANLYLAVAYGCYWLLFRKQTFYTANRVYLLASTVLCFVIPLVQVGRYVPPKAVMQTTHTVQVIAYDAKPDITPAPSNAFFTLNEAAQAIYWLVAASMCVWLIIKLYSLLKLVFHNKRKARGNYTLVYVDQGATPFSFFGFLFVKESEQLAEAMLRHELAHIRQKHSWDIMFMEVLKIMNWFNPVIYLLQNSLKALHEFEADRCAITDKQHQSNYVDSLIAQAYHSNGLPFAHHFSNQQLLKSRIMKLYQKRSGKLARLSYLMAVPLCAGLLCASSLAFSKDYGWIKIGLKRLSPAVQETKSNPIDTSKKNNLLLVQYLNNPKKNRILDSVEVLENDGKKHVYTPLNVTDEDLVRLKRDYKVWIQIMYFPRNPRIPAKSVKNSRVLPPLPSLRINPPSLKGTNVPPPPPPIEEEMAVKEPVYKGAKLPPPPPPPTTIRFPLPKKAIKPAKAGTIMFPPPKVYDESGKEVKPTRDHQWSIAPKNTQSTTAPGSQSTASSFQQFTEYFAEKFKYPRKAITSQTAGYTMVAFKVNSNRALSNPHITEGLSRETDAAILQCFNSYKLAINAKPGNYAMGFILAIEGPVLRDPDGQIKSLGGINLGTKKRTGHELQPNTLTMILRGKEVQMRTSKINTPQPKVASAKKSFIESESTRFNNLANFIKPKSAGC